MRREGFQRRRADTIPGRTNTGTVVSSKRCHRTAAIILPVKRPPEYIVFDIVHRIQPSSLVKLILSHHEQPIVYVVDSSGNEKAISMPGSRRTRTTCPSELSTSTRSLAMEVARQT
jgi:hypothetical protein